MKKNAWALLAIPLAFAMLLAGCGGTPTSGETASADTDQAKGQAKDEYNGPPVTLTVWNQAAGIANDDDLETFLGKPTRSKYPNISFKLVTGKLEDMIASGEIPDLITTSNYYLYNLRELGIPAELSGMIKQEKIDFSKFDPAIVDAMKQFGEKGEIYGMPFAMNYGVTVYNKDIFDKFGVPYPKDNMTWDDMIELSRKVTRKEGDTQYIGLDPGAPSVLLRAHSLPVMDEKREKVVINTEPMKQIFQILQKAYSVPGIVNGNKYTYGFNEFQKEKRVAILPYWLAALTTRVPLLNDAGINWDIVSWPTFPGRPEYGREIDFHLVVLTSTSQNKEAAYKVLKAIASDEAQKEMNKNVRMTILNDPALRKEFAGNMKYYADKNLAGVFKVKPAPLPMVSKYDNNIYSYLTTAAKQMVLEKKDINTALREAEEAANKYVQEQQTSK
jgi:multiple sugar transport system substrate-binding protein